MSSSGNETLNEGYETPVGSSILPPSTETPNSVDNTQTQQINSGLNSNSATLAQLSVGSLSTSLVTNGSITANGQTGIGQYPFANNYQFQLNKPMKHPIQLPLEQPHSRVQCPIGQADTYMLGRSPYVSLNQISKSGGVAVGQLPCTSASPQSLSQTILRNPVETSTSSHVQNLAQPSRKPSHGGEAYPSFGQPDADAGIKMSSGNMSRNDAARNFAHRSGTVHNRNVTRQEVTDRRSLNAATKDASLNISSQPIPGASAVSDIPDRDQSKVNIDTLKFDGVGCVEERVEPLAGPLPSSAKMRQHDTGTPRSNQHQIPVNESNDSSAYLLKSHELNAENKLKCWLVGNIEAAQRALLNVKSFHTELTVPEQQLASLEKCSSLLQVSNDAIPDV